MKKNKQRFIKGTTTTHKSPRFGVLYTVVEKSKIHKRHLKHKKSVDTFD